MRNHPSFFRIIPFAAFMSFIGLEEGLRYLAGKGMIHLSSTFFLYTYPFRALTTGVLLFSFRKAYDELSWKDLTVWPNTLPSIITGVAVFILWINMPWTLGSHQTPTGYNPTLVSDIFTRNSLIAMRLLGAVVVVPIMEELFWRSFLLRYIINPDFTKVAIGQLNWSSFLLSAVLFGFEHHYVVAGIMAGAAYNLLLFRTKSISQCILTHGITNFALAIYVNLTTTWQQW